MPKFTFKKESNNEGKDTLGDPGFVQNRHHTFTADDKVLEKLKVGEEFEMTLRGVIKEIVDVDTEGGDDESGFLREPSFSISVDQYDVYPRNEFSDLFDEDE